MAHSGLPDDAVLTGVALPVADLSRGDDEQAIYNVLAANVVKAQAAEAAGKYPGPVDDCFLTL